MLRAENPDSADFYVKLPQSLICYSRGLRAAGKLAEALAATTEAFESAIKGQAKTDAEGIVELSVEAKDLEVQLLEELLASKDDPALRDRLAKAKEALKLLQADSDAKSDARDDEK